MELRQQLPLILHEPMSRHWRSGWLRFLWHYRLWFLFSAMMWLAGGYLVYAVAL